MTAFATKTGQTATARWTWEVRSVNGRGLDVKVRLPESASPLEADIRKAVGAVATRGNISVSLRLHHDQADGDLQIDQARLDTILDALDSVQERAFEKGVTLAQPTAADVLAQRGVLIMGAASSDDSLLDVLRADFEAALSEMIDMRGSEGTSLAAILSDQVAEIEKLTGASLKAAQERTGSVKTQLQTALARVTDEGTNVDPDRVAQELALWAVKSDITEEIDRLGAHISAARDLLSSGKSIGRKLDFLTQEFNREANTLCSKSQDIALTQIGLALKAVIDQMREQVQNVE